MTEGSFGRLETVRQPWVSDGTRCCALSWRVTIGALLVLWLYSAGPTAKAQTKDPNALVKEAVATELTADETDHSRWRYRYDEEVTRKAAIVVETDYGSVKRLVARGGKPLTEAEAKEEDERLQHLIHDPSRLAKQKKDGEQDDKNAAELLKMLPTAFVWTMKGSTPQATTLHFEPNPQFHPTSLESRVLAVMNGTLVVDNKQHRIQTISGRLTEDVTFGFGLFGRMRQGGTFRVERRELAPGIWQITETHVHIDGKALFFKEIGEQQDEVQTGYTAVPHGTTLEQAFEMSREKR
jgi:hypothetical protein